MRRYRDFIVDSERWERFAFRPDDIVISTPAKCGTTWMQTIIGMLVLDRVDLGAPISTLSPWLDIGVIVFTVLLLRIARPDRTRRARMAGGVLNAEVSFVTGATFSEPYRYIEGAASTGGLLSFALLSILPISHLLYKGTGWLWQVSSLEA